MGVFRDMFVYTDRDFFGNNRSYTMYKARLTKSLGKYKAGTMFEFVEWNRDTLKLRFFKEIEDFDPCVVMNFTVIR